MVAKKNGCKTHHSKLGILTCILSAPTSAQRAALLSRYFILSTLKLNLNRHRNRMKIGVSRCMVCLHQGETEASVSSYYQMKPCRGMETRSLSSIFNEPTYLSYNRQCCRLQAPHSSSLSPTAVLESVLNLNTYVGLIFLTSLSSLRRTPLGGSICILFKT